MRCLCFGLALYNLFKNSHNQTINSAAALVKILIGTARRIDVKRFSLTCVLYKCAVKLASTRLIKAPLLFGRCHLDVYISITSDALWAAQHPSDSSAAT